MALSFRGWADGAGNVVVAEFVKRNPSAPPGYFRWEAAGLKWLDVDDGVRCARVLGVDEESLTLERLASVPPTREAARAFGERLAITHDAGAEMFGSGPDNWSGSGYFGPLSAPLPMSLAGHDRWGEFYARERLEPMAAMAAPRLTSATVDALSEVQSLCLAGHFDDDDAPVRLHGDLWSGNLMWTAGGVVLIDPAAHGGHRETDLAMLALFGCPFLEDIVAGYQTVRLLRDGWPDRLALHQLFPLLVHVALFGGGYAAQTTAAVATVLDQSS